MILFCDPKKEELVALEHKTFPRVNFFADHIEHIRTHKILMGRLRDSSLVEDVIFIPILQKHIEEHVKTMELNIFKEEYV